MRRSSRCGSVSAQRWGWLRQHRRYGRISPVNIGMDFGQPVSDRCLGYAILIDGQHHARIRRGECQRERQHWRSQTQGQLPRHPAGRFGCTLGRWIRPSRRNPQLGTVTIEEVLSRRRGPPTQLHRNLLHGSPCPGRRHNSGRASERREQSGHPGPGGLSDIISCSMLSLTLSSNPVFGVAPISTGFNQCPFAQKTDAEGVWGNPALSFTGAGKITLQNAVLQCIDGTALAAVDDLSGGPSISVDNTVIKNTSERAIVRRGRNRFGHEFDHSSSTASASTSRKCSGIIDLSGGGNTVVISSSTVASSSLALGINGCRRLQRHSTATLSQPTTSPGTRPLARLLRL